MTRDTTSSPFIQSFISHSLPERNSIQASKNWRQVLRLSGLLALVLMAIILWTPPSHLFEGLHRYPPLHTLLETFAVVVAAIIFGFGWNAYGEQRSGNNVLLACAFLAVAVLDTAHFLSYPGMPDFITPSGTEKAIDFWLAARLTAVAALLLIAWRPWQASISTVAARYWLGGTLLYTASMLWLVLFHPTWLPSTFVTGSGLTPFKILTEWLIIGLAALVAGRVWQQRGNTELPYHAPSLFAAAVIMALSELCFTLYSHATDVFNLLGHIYKVIAYVYIYRAVFVVAVRLPYARLSESEERVRRLNTELENRVHERTRQLQTANQELEAFCYSVSHDLRAPLRGIDGFARALDEDYGTQLDATAREYLQRVCKGTQRMSDLIDDLLQLSRISRAELKPAAVDLSTLAQDILLELAKAEPQRTVQMHIAPELKIPGDMRLLHIALTNLLGNAWKFSAHADPARISVGCDIKNGEQVFFVRDNGVGFDMAYVNKLFTPFQRLHGSEFEGTGIGLAIVARVIHRHGGKIWAEAQENTGATFYFSLAS
jgi:signal transduction histidine kinase